jgi:hypothetical protein
LAAIYEYTKVKKERNRIEKQDGST